MTWDKAPQVTAAALALLICCIHLGGSEFVSVQFLGFVLVALLVTGSAISQAARMAFVGSVLASAALLSWYFADHDAHLLMKGFRTAFVLLVFIAWQRHAKKLDAGEITVVRNAVFLACTASLIVAGLQLADSLSLNSGWFDIPDEYFALNYGTTFSGARAALASDGYFIRPSGSFSEPSALAALGVLGVAASYHLSDLRLRIVAFSVVAVSLSLSGILLAGFVSLLATRSPRERQATALLLFALLPIMLLVFEGRVRSVLTGSDLSAQVRVLEPLSVLVEMIRNGYYLGLRPSELMRLTASLDVATIFDNWLLNQFLLYGVLGALWVSVPLLFSRRAIWPVLLAFMVTNGDVFYYDRALLLVFATILASKSVRSNFDYDRNCYLQQSRGARSDGEVAVGANCRSV